MAKKRKAAGAAKASVNSISSKYNIEERFDDSEDDFYTGRDQILLHTEPASKRRRRIQDQEKDLQPSDEEILRYASEDDLSDGDVDIVSEDQSLSDNQDDSGKEQEEEDDQTWGATKSDYYNADIIETEADALEEEAEARRLQQKQLKDMTDTDFGLDESAWVDEKQHATERGPFVEKLPDIRIPTTATVDDKVEILRGRYPEFAPLARDFAQLQMTLRMMQQNQLRVNSTTDEPDQVTSSTKLRALSSYLAAIAMYFAILSSPEVAESDSSKITAIAPGDLRDHAIIRNLIRSREMWEAVKDMRVSQGKRRARLSAEPIQHSQKTVHTTAANPLSNGGSVGAESSRVKVDKSTKKSKAVDDKFAIPPTKKKRTNKNSTVTDLQTLLSNSAVPQSDAESDFGDENPLTEEQAAEKAKKKKSLRFYTSQIVQKANRRGAASREAGGDDDVPHKERLRDRQERLLQEAQRRGQQKAIGNEELGGDSDSDDNGHNGENGYYQSLVIQSKKKKADKQARADAYAEAAKRGAQVYEEEDVGADGKRRITYAIEKNKGLMPKRKKDVRNPRVKKRKKFDEKMKKLGSVRQVYKGGEGKGGYGGELTGIKTNVVKSVKL